ncbi:MAG: hypothetical protein ACI9MR_001771 [Myxococcota bacterium]|jgi:hypothetical protein
MKTTFPTPLSDEAVRTFHEVGFIVVRGLFAAAEVAELAAGFDALEAMARTLSGTQLHAGSQFVLGDDPDGEGVGGAIQRVVWCGAAVPRLGALGCDPRLVAIAGRLLGASTMDQLINQAHFKRPGDGVAFPWHQDSRHRRYGTPVWRDVNGRGSFVEMVTAVDPVTTENGPLELVPHSARLGHVMTDPGTKSLPSGVFDPTTAIAPELAPGDAVLFGPYTIHGSRPNQSTRPRRAFLNGFAYPGANTRVYPGDGAGRRLSL